MKKFLLHFLKQRGVKGMLIGVAIVVPVWTYFWSKQDGWFNGSMICYGVGFICFVMLCEFFSEKIQQWRTTRNR